MKPVCDKVVERVYDFIGNNMRNCIHNDVEHEQRNQVSIHVRLPIWDQAYRQLRSEVTDKLHFQTKKYYEISG